jgi:PhzF family phenazine biosynthesis protein
VCRAGRLVEPPCGGGGKTYHPIWNLRKHSSIGVWWRLGPSKINEMRIPLFHVNAFSGAGLSGNPAAVCLLDSWLDDDLLRKVAAENALSATAFLVGRDGGYEVRWFTPRCEVRLCGHATLASGYVLLELLHPEWHVVNFATRYSGVVQVERDGELLAMNFPLLEPGPCTNVPGELSRALGVEGHASEVLAVSDYLVAVFEDEAAVWRVRPEFHLLEQLHPRVVMVTAPGKDVDFVSRYFAPSYGLPEDPVTGSAHSVLAPYWSKRLGTSKMHARQLSKRGGELWCEIDGERVVLKGKAVLVLRGELTV